jgi:hypothetical protein
MARGSLTDNPCTKQQNNTTSVSTVTAKGSPQLHAVRPHEELGGGGGTDGGGKRLGRQLS